jgi:raffinose/stachyose/melibiose transport system substrate-binding protein
MRPLMRARQRVKKKERKMVTQKISRRTLLKSLAMVAGGTALYACAPNATATPQAQNPTQALAPTAVPAKPVKILFYAGPTGPTDPNAQLPAGQKPKTVMGKIVDDYRQQHPNVSVEWYRYPEGVSSTEWLTARISAQDAPDIYQCLPEDVFPFINKGYALDFGPAYDKPNPYVAGNKAWKDQFLDVSKFYAIGPDGHYYSVIMDQMGVMIVYNKTIFDKLGIKPPKMWSEFMAACKEIKASGVIPIAGDLSYDNWYPEWTSETNLNQLWYDTMYKADDDKNSLIGSKEVAMHVQKGDWYDWDADLLTTKLLKDTVPYLPDGWQGKLELVQLFRQQKCAMWYDGSWDIQNFRNDPPPFEVAWMDLPILDNSVSPKASGKNVAIMGAWGQVNWHIPGYLGTKDPEKVNAIFDLLYYIFTPDNVTAMSTESGMIPAVIDAKAPAEMGPFQRSYDRPVPYQGWENLSEDAYRAQLDVWGAYLATDMSDKDYLDLAKKTLDDQVRRNVEANPDWKVQ